MKFVRTHMCYVMIIELTGFIVMLNYVNCINSEGCKSSLDNVPKVEFYNIARSHSSKQRVLAKKDAKSCEDCKALARAVKGMAFSFKSKHEKSSNKTPKRVSCVVYECPEIDNSTSLVKDAEYDYYSIFADPIPPVNVTCLPRLGVFVLHLLAVNYTTAEHKCKGYGSVLPDIATETRTNKLADLLEYLLEWGKIKEAYVGLANMDMTSFVRSNNERLTCSLFRAWAPGHPRRYNQSCVLLTAGRMWKTVDCRARRPFLCEIQPGGWAQNYDYYDYLYTYIL